MRQKGNAHIFLIVIVIIVGIGAIGYFAYENTQFKKQTDDNIVTPETSQVPTLPTASVTKPPPPPFNPTSNWKTYTNNLIGYSIRYPQNWRLLNLTLGKQIEIYYKSNEEESVGSILIEEINPTNYNNEIKSTQDNFIGINEAKCKTDNVKTWCFLTSDNKYISILTVRLNDQEYNKTLDEILSTFKFNK